MRITKVDIPKTTDNPEGLEAIKMDKLESVVLLAGKNGSGKTRILNKIFSQIREKPTKTQFESSETGIESNRNAAKNADFVIHSLERDLSSVITEHEVSLYKSQISQQKQHRAKVLEMVSYYQNFRDWNLIETNERSENYSFVRFVPKDLNLQDSSSFAKRQLISYATNINVGIDNLTFGTFAKIQVVQDRSFNATHQDSEISNEEKQKAIEAYQRLVEIVGLFLETKIERNLDGDATLFGLPMGQANLSDGQKILLQFCIAIYSQEIELKDLILVMDEPENHLHPSVIIEIIERIKKCTTNGQIWIATHSVPLLAHFDPSLIWYIEKGKITHAGKIPEKVLHSLLGDDDEISRLQEFIGLPAQLATNIFATESLFEPRVVQTGSTDPQSLQIRADLLSLTSKGKLRILDYGAGKGRLISNIADLDEENGSKLIDTIDYIAFDKFPEDKDKCEAALIKAYGSSDNRYYNDMGKLLSKYDKESFDVVIMCNVLHEIDPKDWLKLFNKEGEISRLLSDKGILLLVEDHQIPIGEKAYQNGFLVLDTPELKDLFKITEQEKDFTYSDFRNDGRLKNHCIPKKYLVRIDEDSRVKAIKAMSTTSKEKILDIRGKDKIIKMVNCMDSGRNSLPMLN